MHIDARTIQSDEVITADLCIAGAGVAGVALAQEFVRSDLSVVLLESGGIHPDREMQGLLWGENIGHAYYALDNARSCGFGGSAHKWRIDLPGDHLGARLHPFDEIDFLERSWVPNSGWPFDRAHLDPYYRKAQAVCRSGGYAYGATDWEAEGRPRLRLDPEKVDTTIFHFLDRQTFVGYYLEQVTRSNAIRLLTHATLVGIETDGNLCEVTGLRVDTPAGNPFRVIARQYVLSLGAIECARALLLTQNDRIAGIGNRYDLVGRYFMEHPHLWSGAWIPAPNLDLRQLGLYQLHSHNGTPILGKLVTTSAIQRKAKLLNYCVSVHPKVKRYRRNLVPDWPIDNWPLLKSDLKPLANEAGPADEPPAARNDKPEAPGTAIKKWIKRTGRELAGGMLDRYREKEVHFTLNHMTEQVPNPDSRVTLSPETDRFGRNRVRLDWRLTEQDIRSIIANQEIVDAELRRIGAGRLIIERDIEQIEPKIHGGWHHMGTTRMHTDPGKGVVDQNSKIHETANLYICGPSVFPTVGYANPILTVVALAIRLADHLKALLRTASRV